MGIPGGESRILTECKDYLHSWYCIYAPPGGRIMSYLTVLVLCVISLSIRIQVRCMTSQVGDTMGGGGSYVDVGDRCSVTWCIIIV